MISLSVGKKHRRYATAATVKSLNFDIILSVGNKPILSIDLFFTGIYRPPPSQKTQTNEQTSKQTNWPPLPFMMNLTVFLITTTCKRTIVFSLEIWTFILTAEHSKAKWICKPSKNYNLKQIVNHPTHRSDHTLDWIIVREPCHPVSDLQNSDLLESNHNVIIFWFSVKITKPTNQREKVFLPQHQSHQHQCLRYRGCPCLNQKLSLLDENAPPLLLNCFQTDHRPIYIYTPGTRPISARRNESAERL